MSHTSLKTGSLRANGLDFHFLEAGEGPLALCLHGFPDSPMTWRHILPALAAAGYRAVAPYMRGYAPTSVPATPAYDGGNLAADINALHAALDANADAVLIGHDWGALAAYGAALSEPERWRRCVTLSVPPLPVFGKVAFDYAQIKRSFYFWFFQMKIAQAAVAANDLAFIDGIWADWSPGYDAREDLLYVKRCLGATENLTAALGYYWANIAPDTFGIVVNPQPVLAQPLLYLHGDRDGCIALGKNLVQSVTAYGAPGSRAEIIADAGHFLTVEQPAAVNAQIIDFIGMAGR